MSKELSPAEIGGLEEMVERNSLPEQSFSVEMIDSPEQPGPYKEERPISREKWLERAEEELESWKHDFYKAQLKIFQCREFVRKVLRAERSGMRVVFFEQLTGDPEDPNIDLGFRTEEKGQAGFIKEYVNS